MQHESMIIALEIIPFSYYFVRVKSKGISVENEMI